MRTELIPGYNAEVLTDDNPEPMGPVSELARALKLVLPSVRDPENTANCIAMMMARRKVYLVREGVPFQ